MNIELILILFGVLFGVLILFQIHSQTEQLQNLINSSTCLHKIGQNTYEKCFIVCHTDGFARSFDYSELEKEEGVLND